MEDVQRASALSWIEVQFLAKAVETLGRCRTVLKWTYAMAFYLAKNNQTQMFEDNQKCVAVRGRFRRAVLMLLTCFVAIWSRLSNLSRS